VDYFRLLLKEYYGWLPKRQLRFLSRIRDTSDSVTKWPIRQLITLSTRRGLQYTYIRICWLPTGKWAIYPICRRQLVHLFFSEIVRLFALLKLKQNCNKSTNSFISDAGTRKTKLKQNS